ncbi:MAG: hypothetical protein A2W19_08075 [Spirochaetes bacterium RBG_16_49_21]|nr:MAG: hypothetical protein A2W19_08075 [Spirochaetes bacterium RBG_16_49_21]
MPAFIALALLNCTGNLFKKYLDSHKDKGTYTFSGLLTPDTVPPDISTVTATSHTNVRVVFFDQSQGLERTSAENASNYRIQGQNGNPDVPVTSASLAGDNLTVNLSVQGTPTNEMIHGQMYTLVVHNPSDDVNNVADKNGNYITTKTADFLGRGPVAAELSGTPVNPTNLTYTDIAVQGDDILSYKYKLDDGSWSGEISVSSHIELSALADDTYTLYVVGKDSLNNWQSLTSPTTHAWSVDTAPPTVILNNKPGNPTNNQDTDIVVGGAGVAAYKYRIDGGGWSGEINAGTHITETDLTGDPPAQHTIEVIGRDAAGNWQSSSGPTSYTWLIDTCAPIADLSDLPENPTNSQDVAIQVGGEDITAYSYKIDGGGWIGGYPLPSGIELIQTINLLALSEGSHTIEVLGLDSAGNWQSIGSPTTYTWTVDITAPTAIFNSTPQNPSNNVNPTFTVGGTQVATFRYKLDSGVWSGLNPQTSPINLMSGLAEGGHTLSIVGRDLAGNEQPLGSPTSYTWNIDTTAPVATLSGTPANPTNSQSINVTIGGVDVQAYMYKLDSESWSAEIPRATLISRSGLGEGSHTLYVVGKDSAGNWQGFGTATTHAWTIDLTPPTAILNNIPPDPTNQTSIDVIVAGTDVVYYKYKLDSGAWSAEIGVASHIQLSSLSEGSHTLSVIGRDPAGNWQATGSATIHTWEIDLTVPTALLSNTPPNPTNSRTTNITVSGTDVVSYRYRIDGGGWSAETAVASHIQLSGLSEASHTLEVIAKNAAGTWQETGSATTYTWTVDLTPPGATLTGTPANPANYNTADITVAGTGVIYYQYRLDGGGWSADIPVATPITLSGLSEASHTLDVVGRDAAGNYQTVPTGYTWTVDMTAPAAPAVSDTGTYDSDQNLDFSWTNGGDVAEVKIQIATDSGIVYGGADGTSLGTAQTYTYTMSPSDGPRYYGRVKVRDAAANWSGWGTASNGIDVVGGITGKVLDSMIHAVSGATVDLYRTAGHVFASTTSTNASGDFAFTNVPIGSLAYEITVSKTGFNSTTKTNITVTVGTTDVGVLYLVSTAAQPGTISGRSVDANSGSNVTSATLNVYDWSDNLVQTLTTNSSNGTFTTNSFSPGSYTLVFSKTGYFNLTIDNVIVDGNVGDTTNSRYAMCEILTEPHVRVVVQWGNAPNDLDLHVVGPTNNANTGDSRWDGNPIDRFHVYWSNHKSWNENTGLYLRDGDQSGTSSTTSLVQDDTNDYGPEAINLFGYGDGYDNGIYTFTVHNYSSTDWYASTTTATMRVFDSQGLVMQLSLPTGAGNLDFWQAIKINIQGQSRSQRTITVENTFANFSSPNNKSELNW